MSNFQMVVIGYLIVAAGLVAITLVDGAIYRWLTRDREPPVAKRDD